MAKSRRQKKKDSKTSDRIRNRSRLDQHTRDGKTLNPPSAVLDGKLSFVSWLNDRLPEMLWAALIRASADHTTAILEFRRILEFIVNHNDRTELADVTLTGIGKLKPALRAEFISHILTSPLSLDALQPLVLFDKLPAHNTWQEHLPKGPAQPDLLFKAVGATLWHQSQEATDCRWVRVMATVFGEKLRVPEETLKLWLNYPFDGDQRRVRPSIRAADNAECGFLQTRTDWAPAFWSEVWQRTDCFAVSKPAPSHGISTVTRVQINDAFRNLEQHWQRTHLTTATNAKHDAVFGLGFYALRILDDLLGIGIGPSTLGRLGVRTLFETYATLHYLLAENNETLWKTWRNYGAGQAKLSALKFDETINHPKYIDIDTINNIANEDLWEEFVSINLGNWTRLDLRRLCERSGLKGLYDEHYSWTSGYIHGTWGAVRESCFQTCGNPLHRLHRYPERRTLPDVVDSAVHLADLVLADIDEAYPTFKFRLRHEPSETPEPETRKD